MFIQLLRDLNNHSCALTMFQTLYSELGVQRALVRQTLLSSGADTQVNNYITTMRRVAQMSDQSVKGSNQL